MGFRFSRLRLEKCRRKRKKMPWVRSKEIVAKWAGQLEFRAAHMKHSE